MRFITLAGAALLALVPFAVLAESSASLLQAIKHARVIDLSHTWDEKSPIASVNPHYSFALAATHGNTLGTFGDQAPPSAPNGQLSFASEIMSFSGQHGAPSIDAIGHIGRDGRLFGGVDAIKATSDADGIGRDDKSTGAHLAIDRFPVDLMVNRGVLLDVARMVQGDMSPLPARFEITATHLANAAKQQKVKLRKGDTVFIRTGWGQHFSNVDGPYAGADSPGPGVDAAQFLVKQGARVVGADTLTFEQRPPVATVMKDGRPVFQVFPVHMLLIPDNGIYIIENLNLEELAAAGVYEFPVIVPPLKMRGGTGSALRVFALVQRRG